MIKIYTVRVLQKRMKIKCVMCGKTEILRFADTKQSLPTKSWNGWNINLELCPLCAYVELNPKTAHEENHWGNDLSAKCGYAGYCDLSFYCNILSAKKKMLTPCPMRSPDWYKCKKFKKAIS